jgi:hypothetical protein
VKCWLFEEGYLYFEDSGRGWWVEERHADVLLVRREWRPWRRRLAVVDADHRRAIVHDGDRRAVIYDRDGEI